MAVSRPQLWSLIGLAISIPSAWRAATSLSRMAWAPLIMGGILAVAGSVVRRATPRPTPVLARETVDEPSAGDLLSKADGPIVVAIVLCAWAHPGRCHSEDALLTARIG